MKNNRESVYKPGIYIPNNVLKAEITPLAKILYGALQGFPSFELEGVYASRRTLGRIINCQPQRITELVKTLIDHNFIFINGQKKMESGELIRLLKRVPPKSNGLDPPKPNDLDPPKPNDLVKYNNNIYTSDSPNGESQRVIHTPDLSSIGNDTRPSYWRNRNGIKPSIIRFCENFQKELIKRSPSRFKQYSQEQIEKKIEEGSKVINQLIRLNGFNFDNEIHPCLQWAIEDGFWSNQIRSLAPLRNKSSNGEMKFTNIYDSWVISKQNRAKKGERTFEEKRSNPRNKEEFLETRTKEELEEIYKKDAEYAEWKNREREYERMKMLSTLSDPNELMKFNYKKRKNQKVTKEMVTEAITYMETIGKAFEKEFLNEGIA